MKRLYFFLSAIVISLTVSAQAYSSAPQELDGEWRLTSIGGKKVTGDERPYLYFDLYAGKLYGSNGCNIINANLDINGSRIKLEDVHTSQVFCEGTQQEYMMFSSLKERLHSYKIDKIGHEYYLELFNAQGQSIMLLRKHNMDFLNGVWRVSRIDRDEISDVKIVVAIDIPLRHIHGHAGCNTINGVIFIDPAKDNSLTFSDISATRSTCPDLDLETRFLVALEETEYAMPEGNDVVQFINKQGREVLVLRREPVTK